jgi:hypothetical protein
MLATHVVPPDFFLEPRMRIRAPGSGTPEMPRLPEKRWQFLAWWLGPPLAVLLLVLLLWKSVIGLISHFSEMGPP